MVMDSEDEIQILLLLVTMNHSLVGKIPSGFLVVAGCVRWWLVVVKDLSSQPIVRHKRADILSLSDPTLRSD